MSPWAQSFAETDMLGRLQEFRFQQQILVDGSFVQLRTNHEELVSLARDHFELPPVFCADPKERSTTWTVLVRPSSRSGAYCASTVMVTKGTLFILSESGGVIAVDRKSFDVCAFAASADITLLQRVREAIKTTESYREVRADD